MLQARPGDEVEATVYVVNSATVRQTFDIGVVPVVPQDEGRLSIGAKPDPVTANTHVPDIVVADPGQMVPFTATVDVPKNVEPDEYFVGILVRQQPAQLPAGQISNQLQVLEHIVIDVVGNATRALDVSWHSSRSFSTGGSTHFTASLYASGKAGLAIDDSYSVSSSGFMVHPKLLGDKGSKSLLLASHRRKSSHVHARISRWAIGSYRPVLTATHANTDGTPVTERFVGPKVQVVGAYVIVSGLGIVVLLVGGLLGCAIWIRRRRSNLKTSSTSEPDAPIEKP